MVISPDKALTVGLLLTEGFALMSFASVVEPLRAANLLAGRTLFDIRLLSTRGGVVTSSNGATVVTDSLALKPVAIDLLLVVSGGDPATLAADRRLLALLRYHGRRSMVLGGVSGGPYLLAAAGLLSGYRFTIHWEHASALVERWPELVPERVRYVIDRDRITCGGGIAPLDLMHRLIAERHGAAFAQKVSDWYLHVHVDQAAGPQRASVVERYQVHNRNLALILEKMEATIATPLSRADMARFAGISERHLDRLFARHRPAGFKADYLRIRLEEARSLLRQSSLPIGEIALATGFSSASQFSRAYRQYFGENPGKSRKP